MVHPILHLASLALLSSTVFADSTQASCSVDNKCPKDTPCCSQYGACGVGAYCLGGCDPASSYSLNACEPAPVCKAQSYTFDNLDTLVSQTKYLGDASEYDWVYSGQPINYKSQLWLTMAENTVGTLVKSTHYMWYGRAKATFSTSAGAGVVTAFIILGDSKDEIDFEFVGVELETAQTNFYSQGVTNYDNGQNITGLTDVHANTHEYELDWQPDSITWYIDGNVVRTLNRNDTWNATADRYSYPQTPGQVQLSLWPAGLSSNGQGTVDWAGGLIDWDSQYMVNGYYYASFDSIDVECYDPPSGANVQGSKAYIYTDDSLTNSSVEITNNSTILGSFLATGLDPEEGNTTSSSSPSSKTSNVATIPGLTGAGPGSDGNRGGSSASSSASGSSATAESGSGGTNTASGTASASSGFVQGSGDVSGAAQIGGNGDHALQGSLFAVVIAIVALLWQCNLTKADINSKAAEQHCSIDPSESADQMNVFLCKLEQSLETGKNHLIRAAGSESDELCFSTRISLPHPLAPLSFSFKLGLSSPSLLSRTIVQPALATISTLQSQLSSLERHIKDKDHVISKLLDRIKSQSIDMSMIFPTLTGAGGRNGIVTVEMAKKRITGMEAFDHESWARQFDGLNGEPVRVAELLNGVQSESSGKDVDEDWTHHLPSRRPAEWARVNTSQSQSQTKSQDMSGHDQGTVTSEDEFKRQATPPSLRKTRASPIILGTPADQASSSDRGDAPTPAKKQKIGGLRRKRPATMKSELMLDVESKASSAQAHNKRQPYPPSRSLSPVSDDVTETASSSSAEDKPTTIGRSHQSKHKKRAFSILSPTAAVVPHPNTR
ncbi:hypothetical protein DV736_g627, partial [Chaetothyriales sp. CBS 134916]